MFDNRSYLIRTACRLFANQGFDAVGVQELVNEAGVTKPTLYHYFGSKQGVLEAVLAFYLEPFFKQLSQTCVYQGDLVRSLETITKDYFEFARVEPVFFRLWLFLRIQPPKSSVYESVSPYLAKQQQILAAMFKQAGEQHGNMRGRQDAYTVTFLGMIFTYAGLVLQGELTIDEVLVYQSVHQFMYGIFS